MSFSTLPIVSWLTVMSCSFRVFCMLRRLFEVHRRVFCGLPAVLFSIIFSIFCFRVWYFCVMGLRPAPVLRIRFRFCWMVLFWFCCCSSFLPLIMVVFDVPVSSCIARSPPCSMLSTSDARYMRLCFSFSSGSIFCIRIFVTLSLSAQHA